MSFKDKIKKFFEEIEEDDFNATFEDHEPGNQKYYRLINQDIVC